MAGKKAHKHEKRKLENLYIRATYETDNVRRGRQRQEFKQEKNGVECARASSALPSIKKNKKSGSLAGFPWFGKPSSDLLGQHDSPKHEQARDS